MTPFVKTLNSFLGGAIPPKLQAAMDANPSLQIAVDGGIELGATPTAVNWAALIQLILQLAPLILPYL